MSSACTREVRGLTILVSDRQASGSQMRNLGTPWLPVLRYLSGPIRDRPLAVDGNTVFMQTDGLEEGWLWVGGPYQASALHSRPPEMRSRGVIWWATDVEQAYIWI